MATGLMTQGHGVPGYDKVSWPIVYYFVPPKGWKIAYANLPGEPKTTRGQRKYRKYIELDGCSGLTFGEWLKTDLARRVK